MNALEFRNNLVVITNDIVNVKVMILCKGFIYGKHWIVSTMLKEMEKVIKAFRDGFHTDIYDTHSTIIN